MTVRVLDGLWRCGLWIAALLAVYFICRVAGGPGWLAPAAVALAAAISAWRSREMRSANPSTPGEWIAAGALVALLVAPAWHMAFTLGQGASPALFLDADDAYNLSIAQGLVQAFPPPDLGYAGRTITYHLGGPMLAEMLHRELGVALHTALFAVIPVIAKLVMAGALFGVVTRLAPALDARARLWAAIAAAGVFLIHPYNILWNFRNAWVTQAFLPETWLHGVPVVETLPNLAGTLPFYGSPLALVFVLVLVAASGRAHWILLGATLFAVFLCKASVLVPVGAAWAVYALIEFVRRRDVQPLLAGVLGLGLCLLARPYVVEPQLGRLVPGSGWGIDVLMWFAKGPAAALGLGPVVTAMLGLVALAIATHVFAFALWRVARSQDASESLSAWSLVAAACVCAAMLMCFAVFEPSPEAAARFRLVHAPVAAALWIPADDYLREMGKLSIGEARIALRALFCVAAATAVMLLVRSDAKRALRGTGIAVLAISIATATWQSVTATRAPLPVTTKHVDPQLEEALAAIPVEGSLIFADDCAYDAKVQRHLPLMNAGATALHGHHFWACDFMFGANYAAADAPARLARVLAVRESGLDEATRDFLRGQGVTHVLLRRDSPAGMRDTGLAPAVFANGEYVVLRLTLLAPVVA